jgi:hypothetical protein
MPTNIQRRYPWDGKTFRCGACNSTQTMTCRDRVHADMDQADRIISLEGDVLGYTGFVVFWSPCLSCDYRVEWAKPL